MGFVVSGELKMRFPPQGLTKIKDYGTDYQEGCCAAKNGGTKMLTSVDLDGSGQKGFMGEKGDCYKACKEYPGCNYLSINPNATNGTKGWCTGFNGCPSKCKKPAEATPITLYKMRGADCDWGCYLARYKDLRKQYGKNNYKAAQGHFIRQGDMEGRDCTCSSEKCDDATSYKPLGGCYAAIKWMVLEAWNQKGLPYHQDYKDY